MGVIIKTLNREKDRRAGGQIQICVALLETAKWRQPLPGNAPLLSAREGQGQKNVKNHKTGLHLKECEGSSFWFLLYENFQNAIFFYPVIFTRVWSVCLIVAAYFY